MIGQISPRDTEVYELNSLGKTLSDIQCTVFGFTKRPHRGTPKKLTRKFHACASSTSLNKHDRRDCCSHARTLHMGWAISHALYHDSVGKHKHHLEVDKLSPEHEPSQMLKKRKCGFFMHV